MSEYQYFEFQAIERPLTSSEMADLRKSSSRAEITSRSMSNEYHFGDFKGNPFRLVGKYFDAFVYYANWGTHRTILKVPSSILPLETARIYESETLTLHEIEGYLLLEFAFGEDPPDMDTNEGDAGWMDDFLTVREKLLAGDLRPLYIGWLAGQSDYDDDEDEPSTGPPIPPGMGELTPDLEALAEFLYLDEHLLAEAGQESTAMPAASSPDVLLTWVQGLATTDKDAALLRAMQGHGNEVGRELLQRFRATESKPAATAATRSLADLRAAAEEREANEKRAAAEKAAQAKAKTEREAAAARESYLKGLAGKEDDLWLEVEKAISFKQAAEYDKAVRWLLDLKELAQRAGKLDVFTRRLMALRDLHRSKSSLTKKLNAAGL